MDADLLILHGHVLTMDRARPEIPDGGVAVVRDRIAALGPADALARDWRAAATIDARGCAVLPGLVDAYAHAGHGMIRGLFHPQAGWPAWPVYWHHAPPSWWRAESRLAALERLCAGVTTGMSVVGATPARADSPESADEVAAAYDAAGLGLVLGIGPPDPVFPHLPEPFEATRGGARVRFTADDTIAATRAVASRWHGAGGGRIRVALAPPYLFGRHVAHRRNPHRLPDASDAPAILAHARAMRALAAELGVTIHTHMFAGSVAYALANFGVPETERLLGPDVAVAHANGLGPEEVRVLGSRGCGIATVAYTHENLWYGVAPIPALIAAGSPVAITTDGAAPYTSLDLWRELARAVWNQWQVAGQDVLPPETALRMVTLDAARVLGVADRVGSLEPGKDADVAVVDLARPHLGPVADLAASLVFYAAASDVRDVVAKGRVLLRDRKPLHADAPAILADARAEAARALAAIDLTPYRRAAPWSGRASWDVPLPTT